MRAYHGLCLAVLQQATDALASLEMAESQANGDPQVLRVVAEALRILGLKDRARAIEQQIRR